MTLALHESFSKWMGPFTSHGYRGMLWGGGVLTWDCIWTILTNLHMQYLGVKREGFAFRAGGALRVARKWFFTMYPGYEGSVA